MAATLVSDECIVNPTVIGRIHKQFQKVPRIFLFHRNEAMGNDTTASVIWWSEFLTANTEVPGSIPGCYQIF
jgi:hypothetical protein